MPNKRNLKDYGFLVLKGMGMGGGGCSFPACREERSPLS